LEQKVSPKGPYLSRKKEKNNGGSCNQGYFILGQRGERERKRSCPARRRFQKIPLRDAQEETLVNSPIVEEARELTGWNVESKVLCV